MATTLDLFCGAGGLSLGLKAAGFQCQLAVDSMLDAAETYAATFPDAALHRGRVEELDFKKWRGVDLVAGGPPCQPFSTGGKSDGRDDARDMLPQFVRAVIEARPKAFLMENVAGLATTHLAYLTAVMAPLGHRYEIVGPLVLNAADFGVPQKRRRMVVIGLLKGSRALKLPANTVRKHKASGDVLAATPRGAPNESRIVFAKNPDLRPSPYDGQLFNGGGRPVDLDGPAPTILASAGGNKTPFLDVGGLVPSYHHHLMHGGAPRVGDLEHARRLTVQECALLQTFPKGMKFSGSRSAQYTQIGNAVPPKLAAVLGRAIAEAICLV